MAKRQTRKSISVSRDVYALAKSAAAARSMSLSELVEDGLRALGIDVPRGVHLDKATREYKYPEAPIVHVSSAPSVAVVVHAEPPRVTRAELDAIAAARRAPLAPPPGTHCANCVDAKATHRGRVDRDGPEFWLCSECVLPDDDDESTPWKRRTA